MRRSASAHAPAGQRAGRRRALGIRYAGKLGTAYAADQVDAWASAPVLTPGDLAPVLPAHTDLAMILRQSPPTPALSDDPSGRTWYGCHAAAAGHPDPGVRAQQADASRMWWRVSPGRLSQIRAITASGSVVPLMCTVSKAVITGYDITGIEDVTYPGTGRVAFTVTDPGPWLRRPGRSVAERRPGHIDHLVEQVQTSLRGSGRRDGREGERVFRLWDLGAVTVARVLRHVLAGRPASGERPKKPRGSLPLR